MVVPKISTVLAILGGIGCVGICFVIPVIAYITVFPERKCENYSSIIIASVLVAIGIGACINALMQLFSL